MVFMAGNGSTDLLFRHQAISLLDLSGPELD